MGNKYTTVSVSGYNSTPPSDDGTVSESNKIKWSTIKTKLPDPLNTAIAEIDSKLTAHFNNGPTALITSTTLDSTHYNKIIQVSGAGVTLTLTDANTLTAGWYCEIVSTDASNSVTLGRATSGDTINETAANVTILPLQALRVVVNAAGTGFLVNTQGRHSKTYKTAEDTTHTGTITMSGKSINEAKGANVASVAGTTDIWTPADGNTIHITGTEIITGLGTASQAGAKRQIIADGAFTLTHNASTLVCPSGADITCAANDSFTVYADTTTKMYILDYQKASGESIIPHNVISYTSNGTLIVPSGVTSIVVLAVAGGGGGQSGYSACDDTTGGYGGAGGGAGGFILKPVTVTPGESISVTIGTKGTGGASHAPDGGLANNGTAGSNTVFGSYVTVTGGPGGSGSGGCYVDSSGTGGAPGGSISFLGFGGAGGSGTSIGGNGGDGSAATGYGGGGGAGGGGGGSTGAGGTSGAGGNGSDGILIIWY